MKCINEIKLEFLSCSSNEAFARVAIAAFAAQLDPTVDELSDIKTMVSEAVTNCIVHGYSEGLGVIYITARLYENNRIFIAIRDRGCGIENVAKAMEPLYTSCTTGERAGMGFSIMQAFSDRLRVSSRVGGGTRVAIERRLSPKPMINR